MPIKQNGSRLGVGGMVRSLWGLILGARRTPLPLDHAADVRATIDHPHARLDERRGQYEID